MPSKLAIQLSVKVSLPADAYAVVFDESLAPVRECLAGLAVTIIGGKACWCPDYRATEKHTEACQRARELWNSLQVTE